MLKMWCPVLGFLQLILGILPKFALDIINENLRIFKIFLEKSLKLWLYDKNSALIVALVLGPLNVDSATKEESSKQDIIHPSSSKFLKIIFILLIKLITLYIRFF